MTRRNDSGFTLLELLIAVSVLGIVVSCIAGALVTGFMSEPEVRHRSTYASEAAFLISQLSDDVANATSVGSLNSAAPLVKTVCTPTTVALGRVVASQTQYIDYAATITDASTATSNGGSVHEVDITRTELTNTNVVTKTDTVLTAWCQQDALLGYGAWFADPTYSLELEMQPSPGSIERELSLSAAVRVAPAGQFILSGSVKDAGGTGLNGWQVNVYDATDASKTYTATTNAAGTYSVQLPVGAYRVCEVLAANYTESSPASGPACTVAGEGALGLTANPATTSATFTNTYVPPPPTTTTSTSTTTTTLPGNRPACTAAAVPPALDPATGFWPGNKGIDYGVRVDLGQNVQTAVDNAAKPDSATTGDINGDGVIIIMVYGTPTGWGGSASQSVVISANYNKKFALFGCSVTLKNNGSGPGIWVKSTANAFTTWMPEEKVNANIYINNLHGGQNQTGIQIDGSGRYLDSEQARTNTAGGIKINGDTNVVHGGDATGNTGVGLAVVGSNNIIDDSFNAMSSTSHGISVQGNSNQLLTLDVGEKATPNGGDGIHMTGNLNTLDSDDILANTGNGLWLSGDSNVINKNNAGVHNKGNHLDGYHVSGNANVFTSNKADENAGDGFDVSGATTSANMFSLDEAGSSNVNTGAEFRLLNMISNLGNNKAAGTVVPKITAPTKCNTAGTQFPSGSTNFAAVQACD